MDKLTRKLDNINLIEESELTNKIQLITELTKHPFTNQEIISRLQFALVQARVFHY